MQIALLSVTDKYILLGHTYNLFFFFLTLMCQTKTKYEMVKQGQQTLRNGISLFPVM